MVKGLESDFIEEHGSPLIKWASTYVTATSSEGQLNRVLYFIMSHGCPRTSCAAFARNSVSQVSSPYLPHLAILPLYLVQRAMDCINDGNPIEALYWQPRCLQTPHKQSENTSPNSNAIPSNLVFLPSEDCIYMALEAGNRQLLV